MKIKHQVLFLLAATLLLHANAWAGKHEYKKARAYADENAWYVGSWVGENASFEPPLSVEITILGSGEVYSFVHGQGKAYRVTQGGRAINLDKLTDTPLRGKVLDSDTLILEDGGKLTIRQTGQGLETIVPELELIVQYQAPKDPGSLAAIEQRVAEQQETEAHHKDHDFWHSEKFWDAVADGVVAGASNHDDHVTVKSPELSKEETDSLNSLGKYYK